MPSNTSENKRIAKNTIMLYVRMLLLILVNLYSSRVVLAALGVEDYGLYSVVGSIVVFLGFVNASMITAAQRFMSYAKGIGSAGEQNSVFNSIVIAQIAITLLILLLAETLGTLYIQYGLNAGSAKIGVAHAVFQLSLLSLLAKTLSVPYNAAIVANERMDAFAIISMIEAGLQLFAAISLRYIENNRLLLYAALMCASVAVTQLLYCAYSRLHFTECRLRRTWKKEKVVAIFSFSGWNLLGSLSNVAIEQGVNMPLNAFCGVVVNAARGISFQVSGAIASLSGNFQQALNPPIVKNYAAGEMDKMHALIINGTRYSFYLLLLLSLPVLFNMHGILSLWLGQVPPFTEVFCILVLINAVISYSSGLFNTGAMATGKIRNYQILNAGISLLNLPLSFLALWITHNPYITAWIMIAISVSLYAARLVMASRLLNMSVIFFIKKGLLPCVGVVVIAIPLLFAYCHIASDSNNVWWLFLNISVCLVVTTFVISNVGMSAQERFSLLHAIRKAPHSLCKK